MVSGNRGFSLIEVCLALIIIGLIGAPLIVQYKVYLNNKAIAESNGYLLTIQSAFKKYAIEKGHYPLPARRDLGPDNAGFGQAFAGALSTIPVCAAGGGDTDVCKTASPSFPGQLIYIGDIPHAALGLPKKFIIDGYGSKFTYAVSAQLTAAASFTDTGGVIRVIDRSGNPAQGSQRTQAGIPFDNVHYVVLSHGADTTGAFSLEGVLRSACNLPGADRENCDNDGVFTNNYGTDPTGAYNRYLSMPAGAAHYDDYLYYSTSTTGDIWSVASTNTDIFSRNAGSVMIGPGMPVAKLDVNGTVQADRLNTNRICDLAGCAGPGSTGGLVTPAYAPNIFNPGIIAGPEAATNVNRPGGGINCGSGKAMRAIGNADEICYNGTPPGALDIGGCVLPQRARGTDATGRLICETP